MNARTETRCSEGMTDCRRKMSTARIDERSALADRFLFRFNYRQVNGRALPLRSANPRAIPAPPARQCEHARWKVRLESDPRSTITVLYLRCDRPTRSE